MEITETLKKYKYPLIGIGTGIVGSIALYYETEDFGAIPKIIYANYFSDIGTRCFCFIDKSTEYAVRIGGALIPPAIGGTIGTVVGRIKNK